ncbi:MAG: transcriptional repressor, partial [Oscillospiraceae bacterium]|nr:transcriptional repressor [Oscillospiraceae bacterium]
NGGEEAFRYDANITQHSHVQCSRCGRVDDIPSPDLRALAAQVEKDTQYRVDSHQMYFYGVCPECRALETMAKTAS